MPVSLKELFDAYLFANFDGGWGGNEAILCLSSGKIYLHSELAEMNELPDDIEDEEKYVRLPHKTDLGLGKPLALEFTREFLPGDLGKVGDIFRRKGAYARFKDLLAERGVLQKWYDYESEAETQALRDWCRACEIDLID